MKVIDARSGKELKVGQTILYNTDGEFVRLLDLKPNLLSALALLHHRYADQAGKLVDSVRWSPLTVRWTHPRFFLQHVGFIES